MKIAIIGATAITLAVSGCMQAPDTKTATSAPAPKAAKVKKNDIVFNYSANGKTYKLHARYDSILRAYGTALSVVSGAPFTGATAEDAEAQNTIRDAFRAQGICKDGLHPGLLQFGYGYAPDLQSWGAKVRCSDKNQGNI